LFFFVSPSFCNFLVNFLFFPPLPCKCLGLQVLEQTSTEVVIFGLFLCGVYGNSLLCADEIFLSIPSCPCLRDAILSDHYGWISPPLPRCQFVNFPGHQASLSNFFKLILSEGGSTFSLNSVVCYYSVFRSPIFFSARKRLFSASPISSIPPAVLDSDENSFWSFALFFHGSWPPPTTPC